MWRGSQQCNRSARRGRFAPCAGALTLVVSTLAAVGGSPRQALAATYAFNKNNGSFVWNDTANWSGGAVPTSDPDTVITFSTTLNTTAADDLGISGLQLNRLSMTSTGTKSLTVSPNAGNSLNFVASSVGVLPTVQFNRNNTGSFTLSMSFTVTDALTITSSGTDAGTVSVTGTITNNGGITFSGAGVSSVALSAMSGTGGITQNASYTVSTGSTETYFGATAVNSGIFKITGTGTINNTSGVTINGGEFAYASSNALTKAITFTSGTLSGTGTVTAVAATNNNDTIAPGATSAATSYGVLTVKGDLSLKDAASNGSSSGGKLAIGVSKAALGGSVGAAGGTYDQLAVVSTATSVDLTNGVLMLTMGANIEAGDVYYILNNQISSGGLTGTFGSATINGTSATASTTNIAGTDYQSFSVGPVSFALSYNAVAGTSFGGSGNDVALQIVSVPEPASLGFAAFGAAGLLNRRRRGRGIISN